MTSLKNIIKVKNCSEGLVRLGNLEDGGYVVSRKAIDKSVQLYTYGVGSHWHFERDYIKRAPWKTVRMFDHTVDVHDTGSANIAFFKRPLAPTEKSTTFDESRDKNTQIFLKLDVEGAEYPFFEKEDFSSYTNVTGICCEFHNLGDATTLDRFKKTVTRLCEYYDIIHVHGNNYGPLLDIEGFTFPNTPEISFLHKSLNEGETSYKDVSYPLAGLDFPNWPAKADYRFQVFQ